MYAHVRMGLYYVSIILGSPSRLRSNAGVRLRSNAGVNKFGIMPRFVVYA